VTRKFIEPCKLCPNPFTAMTALREVTSKCVIIFTSIRTTSMPGAKVCIGRQQLILFKQIHAAL
jgi:hypothetical protein